MKQQLILLRGLPGAGKSTFAKTLLSLVNPCGHDQPDNMVHYEADQFFTNELGEYHYEGLRIEEAHRWCMTNTESALRDGRSVVVSNTFTRNKEMAPYVGMAKQFGAVLTVLHVQGNHGSIHDIPDAIYRRMMARWEHFNEARC
jgi:predicted kinase